MASGLVAAAAAAPACGGINQLPAGRIYERINHSHTHIHIARNTHPPKHTHTCTVSAHKNAQVKNAVNKNTNFW